jgi:hypothetical protein
MISGAMVALGTDIQFHLLDSSPAERTTPCMLGRFERVAQSIGFRDPERNLVLA